MYIYVIGTVLAVFFAKCAMNVKQYPTLQRSYRIWAILSFLPLFLISALRHNVGTDYDYVYVPYYYAINAGESEFSEVGFNLINKITYFIVDDPALMFAVVAFLTLMFMFLAFYQQSDNVCYSIFWFVLSTAYFNSMNQIRQLLAISIFLYAMKYIHTREAKKYYLWMLFALSMHTSAIMFFPLYFMYKLKVNVKVHLIILAGVILSAPFMQIIIRAVISLTPYAWYMDSLFGDAGFSLVQFVFNMIIIFLLYFCYLNSSDTEDKSYDFMLNMYLIAVILVTYSAAIPQSNRLINSMTSITPFIIPKALLRIKERNRRIVMLFIFLGVYGLRMYYDVYFQGWYDVLPYQTIFSR